MKDQDIFRDSPLRLMGYFNEVGESFRPLVPRSLVTFSYVASFAYVFADTSDKTIKKWNQCSHLPTSSRQSECSKAAADTLIWQTFASVLIPGLTIQQVVKWTKKVTDMSPLKMVRNSVPTMVGLAAIPFIVHPIDLGVDFVMDNTIRPFLSTEDVRNHK